MNTTHPVLKTVTEVEGRSPWPAGSRLLGDCRTRRCSNGVVTPSSQTLILSWFGPPPSAGRLGAQTFNLDTQPLRGRVSWSRRHRSAQLRSEPAADFVRGSERESAGVTAAVPVRYRGGPGR